MANRFIKLVCSWFNKAWWGLREQWPIYLQCRGTAGWSDKYAEAWGDCDGRGIRHQQVQVEAGGVSGKKLSREEVILLATSKLNQQHFFFWVVTGASVVNFTAASVFLAPLASVLPVGFRSLMSPLLIISSKWVETYPVAVGSMPQYFRCSWPRSDKLHRSHFCLRMSRGVLSSGTPFCPMHWSSQSCSGRAGTELAYSGCRCHSFHQWSSSIWVSPPRFFLLGQSKQ